MISLSEILTYFLSIVGLAVASGDILRMWFSLDKKNDQKNTPEDSELLGHLKEFLKNPTNRDSVVKDYEICQAEVARRDSSTLLIGSIFTTASLLILANTISQTFSNSTFIYALASILLYLLWLLTVYRTSRYLDQITYTRIRIIEEAMSHEESGYKFGLHSDVWRKTHTEEGKTVPWLRLRRAFWSIILLLISFSWMLLSLVVLWPFSRGLILWISLSLIFLAVWSYVCYLRFRESSL
jgi:hypothetical protein